MPLPPPPEPSTAAAVLGELQRRYAKWRQRNYNYSRLLAFLAFIGLLLGVLFLQRGSHTSFEVRGGGVAARLPRVGMGTPATIDICACPGAAQPNCIARLCDVAFTASLCCDRCTARWRRGCCPPATWPPSTTCTPGCAACWRACGATPCAGMACARAPLSMLSTVSAGRVHVELSTNRSWSQPCTQPARLLLPAGRFGCRADCGRLQDIQNLTAVRIDLDYDFSHPSGSIPATASVLGGRRGSRPEQPCAVCCGKLGWWTPRAACPDTECRS